MLTGIIGFAFLVFMLLPGKKVTIDLLVEEQSVPLLTKNSSLVIIGTVTKQLPSQLTMSRNVGDKIVYTDYVVSVEKALKGNARGDLTVRLIGGTVGSGKDKFFMSSDDEVQLKTGEKVLLFLSKNDGGFFDLPGDHYVAQGRFQGKYELINGRAVDHRGKAIEEDELTAEILSNMDLTK